MLSWHVADNAAFWQIVVVTCRTLQVLDAGHSITGSATAATRFSNSGGTAGSFIASEYRSGAVAQSFVGTPNILAPEQLGGAYNQKADIWALGCVLYQMAALRPAFSADRIAVIYRMIRRARAPQLPGMYSAGLRVLYQQLMQKDPCSRPSSLEVMQDPLLRWVLREKMVCLELCLRLVLWVCAGWGPQLGFPRHGGQMLVAAAASCRSNSSELCC
jgi:serine/threonine protein kinase